MEILNDRLEKAFNSMTLSPSGFRKVFAFSGDKEDTAENITKEDSLIVVAITETFITELQLKKGDAVLLSRDARPTGRNICAIIYRVLAYHGVNVCYSGICSAPETFAESTYYPYQCFIYVSASHNPIGYNGIKAGKNGAVFDSDFCNAAICTLKSKICQEKELIDIYESSLNIICNEDSDLKKRSLEHYADFVKKTFNDVDSEGFEGFKSKIKTLNLGIVADLNGSARCNSIDKQFLTSLGIKTAFINDVAGMVAHGIVPEGENLEPCRALLEKMHKEDSSYILGYMPDNDGDRGNLVYINKDGKAEILKAQEVFALCVYSLLSVYSAKNPWVVVNCCTSRRIDEIAEKCNSRVYRAEVGEPNVVGAAEELRKTGVLVPVLGEGSNGGNIVHPAKVRDPLNTLMCMILILQNESVCSAIEKLPKYTTTDAYFEEGVMHIWDVDFKKLKYEYIDNYRYEFKHKKKYLSGYGIMKYKMVRTSGFKEEQIELNFKLEEFDKMSLSGSIKVYLMDDRDNILAYMWLRPSGTEPLLRVLVDVKGDGEKAEELHNFLLKWQREMVSFIVSYMKE